MYLINGIRFVLNKTSIKSKVDEICFIKKSKDCAGNVNKILCVYTLQTYTMQEKYCTHENIQL